MIYEVHTPPISKIQQNSYLKKFVSSVLPERTNLSCFKGIVSWDFFLITLVLLVASQSDSRSPLLWDQKRKSDENSDVKNLNRLSL